MPPTKLPWSFPSAALAWLYNHTIFMPSIMHNTFKWKKCCSFFSVNCFYTVSFLSEGTLVSLYFCLNCAHWGLPFCRGILKAIFINYFDKNQHSEEGEPHIWPQSNDSKLLGELVDKDHREDLSESALSKGMLSSPNPSMRTAHPGDPLSCLNVPSPLDILGTFRKIWVCPVSFDFQSNQPCNLIM